MFQRNSQSLINQPKLKKTQWEIVNSFNHLLELPDIENIKGNVSLTLSVIILTHLILILESQSWNMYH